MYLSLSLPQVVNYDINQMIAKRTQDFGTAILDDYQFLMDDSFVADCEGAIFRAYPDAAFLGRLKKPTAGLVVD